MAIDFVFNDFPILTTNRLTLRQVTLKDVDAIYQLYSNDQVTRFLDIESLTTRAQAQDETNFYIRNYKNQNAVRWAITQQEDDSLIGTIGFHNFSRIANFTEIGYELMPQFWRKGIMTEAVGAVLKYGFDTLGLNRIEATVTVGNAASATFLEKLGFKQEGILRDRMFIRGNYHSLIYYGLLQAEY